MVGLNMQCPAPHRPFQRWPSQPII